MAFLHQLDELVGCIGETSGHEENDTKPVPFACCDLGQQAMVVNELLLLHVYLRLNVVCIIPH